MATSHRAVCAQFLGKILVGVILLVSFELQRSAAQEFNNAGNVGFPSNGVFDGSTFDTVQLNNGNLHIEIPLWSTKGRGGVDVTWKYVYDSQSFYLNMVCRKNGCTSSVKLESGGHAQLSLVGPYDFVVSGRGSNSTSCTAGLIYSGFSIREPDGTKHHLLPDQVCTQPPLMYADDASGWAYAPATHTAIRKDGLHITGVRDTDTLVVLTDTNGNQITEDKSVSPYSATDTLGRAVPTDGSYYDSGGVQRSIVVTTQSLAVQTNECTLGGCTDYTATWTVPQVIQLPNGLKYTFTYAPNSWGQPTSVTLPTGGQISWTYEPAPLQQGLQVASRTVTVGGQSYTTNYSYTSTAGCWTTTKTDPASNDTVLTTTGIFPGYTAPYYLRPDSPPCYASSMKYYMGSSGTSSNLVKTITSDYDNSAAVLLKGETTIWSPQNLYSRVETDWDNKSIGFCDTGCWSMNISWGNRLAGREYAFGSGNYGTLARTTAYSYLHLGAASATYLPLNIADRPTGKTVYDSGSTNTSNEVYTYDGSTLISTSTTPAPNHDYTNFSSGFVSRGNVTQISRLQAGTTYVNTTNAYDDLGNLRSSTDPGGHPTTYDYTDSWQGSGCVGSNTFAYVTKGTDAMSHRVERGYYPCTGLVYSVKDENDIVNGRSGTTQTYDLMNRSLITTFPDGGVTTNSYNDIGTLSNTVSQLISGSISLTKTTIVDNLGRISQIQLQNDPDCGGGSGLVKTDFAYGYDPANHVRFQKVSTPYCNTPDSTYGLMATTNYDTLDRVISIAQPDGSTITTSYSGGTTTGVTTLVTDEAGKQRRSETDGSGRLTKVWEDPSGLNFETDYTYDALGNLTSVTQRGSPYYTYRSFTYDSLSRLICAANPELTPTTNPPTVEAVCPSSYTSAYTHGTTQYNYNADGTIATKVAPQPNQTSTSATVTTAYSYDALDRLTQKVYTGGTPSTPTVNYAYDGSTSLGACAPTISPADVNPIGYRTSMCDGSGGTAWSHDPLGRVLRAKEIIAGSVNSTQVFIYQYNSDGSLWKLQYPSGRTITYTTSGAGRATSAKDNGNGINYVFGATYAPHGALTAFTNHASINAAFSYNSRLQPLQAFYGTNTVPPLTATSCPTGFGNIMHRVYHLGAGSNDNGNVLAVDNCKDTNRTVTYVYDSLNRLQSATTQGTTCVPGCWGQLFGHMSGSQYVSGYDAGGNLFEITATQGSPTTLSQTMVANANQFVGMTYDAVGNLINDGGGNAYVYDAESRLVCIGTCASGTWTYTYDGDGRRVKKCNSCSSSSGGTLYWMGKGANALVESDLAGTLTYEYVFFNGRRVARRDNSSSPPTYYFADHLGSTSVIAGSGGTPKNESDYYPFGGEVIISNTLGAPQNYKFTGKERDIESGLDNFGTRYSTPALGRFVSPDPINLTRARLTNPNNTLNKYAYAANNPLKYIDADGKDVTIFYRPPSGASGDYGHIFLGVLNQSTGQTGFLDYYPKNGADSLGRGAGAFNTGDMQDRAQQAAAGAFATMTIQTSPEEAQKLLNQIANMVNGSVPDYSALTNNCTTTCEDVLHDLGLDFGDILPSDYWDDLYRRYSQDVGNNPFKAFRFSPAPSKTGVEYGFPRGGQDYSQLLFRLYLRQLTQAAANAPIQLKEQVTHKICWTDDKNQVHCQ